MINNTLKQNITQTLIKNIDETFDSLQGVLDDIQSGKDKLANITLEYVKVSSDIEKINKESDEKRLSLSKDINQFENYKQEFEISKKKFEQYKLETENDFVNKITSRDNLLKEIELLEKKLTNLNDKIKASSVLSDKVDSLTKEITEKNTELDKINVAIDTSIITLEKQKVDSKKELDIARDELEKVKKIVLPTIEQLNEREKKIAIKEESLKIIEERYKRLYADKGVGFKVN